MLCYFWNFDFTKNWTKNMKEEFTSFLLLYKEVPKIQNWPFSIQKRFCVILELKMVITRTAYTKPIISPLSEIRRAEVNKRWEKEERRKQEQIEAKARAVERARTATISRLG